MTEPIRTNKIGLEIKKRLEAIDNQQKQIDQLVIDGDSSPESAQARVDGSGNTYTTLKNRLDTKDAEINEKVDQNQSDTAAQLAEKANQTYVDQLLSMIGNGAPKELFYSISALNTAYPTGTEGPMLVLDSSFTDGAHTMMWNGSIWGDVGLYQGLTVSNGAINPKNINTVTPDVSTNLFDPTAITKNCYVDYNSGQIVTSTLISISDFIPVVAGQSYAFPILDDSGNTLSSAGAFYTSDKTFLSGISGDGDVQVIKAPASAQYLRINFANGKLNNTMIFIGHLPDEYVPYGGSINWLVAERYKDKTIESIKLSDYQKIYNLFDRSKVTHDIYVDNTGSLIPNGTVGISDFIPVNVGDIISFDCKDDSGNPLTYAGAFYKSDQSFLSSIAGSSLLMTVSIPDSAAYLRVNFSYKNIESLCIVKNDHIDDNMRYGFQLKWGLTPFNAFSNEVINVLNRWFSSKINALGDSIMFGVGTSMPDQRYLDIISKFLGADVIRNYGISGTLITQTSGRNDSFVERYQSMDDDADLIIVFGGTNDYWHETVPLGNDDESPDPTNFKGALNVLMAGLLNKYLGKEIVFITPYSQFYNGHSSDDPNALGFTLKDFRDAIIDRAEYHGIPVLDLYSVSGMDNGHNEIQRNYFTVDGLHPNAVGNRRIANRLIGFLKSI
jgi:lysophospholipase L1-like esterase